jgi:hypothetical protein
MLEKELLRGIVAANVDKLNLKLMFENNLLVHKRAEEALVILEMSYCRLLESACKNIFMPNE